MKGIVFNLLEQVVSDAHGEDVWEDLLDQAGVEGAFTAVGSYPDEKLLALVGVASAKLDISADDLVRWFGRNSIPLLYDRYPAFFDGYTETVPFLLTLNEVIHPEVRKLFPGAYAPSFEFKDGTANALTLSYHSHRNLCSFAEGLIEGAADHYGQAVTIEQPACSKRGDDRCVLATSFTPR